MRALVLGAYGHYGKILCQKLLEIPGVTVIGAGKRNERLSSLSNELDIETILIDWRDKNLSGVLVDNDIHLVIHAAGPFYGQDYSVAQACIDAQCYYVDLADNRDFVSGIQVLDDQARNANVVVVSGMGLMSLTDAIAEYMQDTVSIINHMDVGYSGSGRVPGEASVLSMLHYAGQPVSLIDNGKNVEVLGLQDRTAHHFGGEFMSRDMVNLDGPELDFLTAKYCLKSVSLKGGFGDRGQKVLSFIAKMASKNWVKNRYGLSSKLAKLCRFFERSSAKKGGLFVEIEGRDGKDKVVEAVYELHTTNHKFDELKVISIVALVGRLMTNFVPETGAYPALGLIRLEDALAALGDEDVTVFQS